MKERPILFNGAMVRAILDGRKTQTRRVVKSNSNNHPDIVMLGDSAAGWWPYLSDDGESEVCGDGNEHPMDCPYGQPGDRLWVRENFCALRAGDYLPVKPQQGMAQDIRYQATDRLRDTPADVRGYGWRPSIHMPRWARRITLEVTAVRVERLQDISRHDALSEGVDWKTCPTRQTEDSVCAQIMADRMGMSAHYVSEIDYVGGFKALWVSTYGTAAWAANPWVWVVEFKRA